MDVTLRDDTVDSSAASRLELRFDPSEHRYISAAIRDRLWFLPPIEIASRLLIPAELAFDALAALFVAESLAATSGVSWYAPPRTLPFPLLRPSRGAFEFRLRLDEEGSLWMLTLPQATFLQRCAFDATQSHEDAPFGSTFGIPRRRGIEIATALHAQIRAAGTPIPRWF